MKSGPTLNGWTTRPRRRAAATSARATVVLPLPLAGAAISTADLSSKRRTNPCEEVDRRRAEAERLVVALVEQVLDLGEHRELGTVREHVLERVRGREGDLAVRRVLVERETVRRVHVLTIADDVHGEIHVPARAGPDEVAAGDVDDDGAAVLRTADERRRVDAEKPRIRGRDRDVGIAPDERARRHLDPADVHRPEVFGEARTVGLRLPLDQIVGDPV